MDNFAQIIDRLHADSLAEIRPSSGIAPPRMTPGVDSPAGMAGKFPTDLSVVSTRRLRALCNQTYELMDDDYPPREAKRRYEALVEEIERRETIAENQETITRIRSTPEVPREAFRNNRLFSRFELFVEGRMAGYMKYEMRGGEVLLLQTVVDPLFRRMRVESLLIHHVLLDTHRCRLAVTPYCPEVRGFLDDNPQYLTLLPSRQRRRFKVLQAVSDSYENADR